MYVRATSAKKPTRSVLLTELQHEHIEQTHRHSCSPIHFDPSPKAKGHRLCPMLCLWSGQHRTAMLFLGKARLQATASLWQWWMTGWVSPRLSECVWREAGTEIKAAMEVTCDSYAFPSDVTFLFSAFISLFFSSSLSLVVSHPLFIFCLLASPT